MSSDNSLLPPGWEARYDHNLGKTYYINHIEKITTWEHPCKNRKPASATSKSSFSKQSNGNPKHSTTTIGVDYIPLQHGSPDLRRNYVYPSQPSPIPAFEVSPTQSPKINIVQELNYKTRGSPLSVRSKVQDTSLSNTADNDQAISKLSAMFPTVSDAHIRLLMKKFHNREVLVISALQVEKNPITTPGPFATPPPQRNILQNTPLFMTPPLGVRTAHFRGGSPILKGSGSNIYTGSPRIGEGFKSSRPHSSPKLKLSYRYMKSIFPQAEETIILDVLSNNENNIQKTSDKLKEMGFKKKDSIKLSQQEIIAKAAETKQPKPEPPVIPKPKTMEEKMKVKLELQKEHLDVPEQLITIALESVSFDKEKASNLLKNATEYIVKVDGGKIVQCTEVENDAEQEIQQTKIAISQSRQSLKSLLKSEKIDKENNIIFNRVIEESNTGYKSDYLSNTNGANPILAKGNDEKLLLEDYVKWQGPNPSLHLGPRKGLAHGPQASCRIERKRLACGPNPEFHRGPNKSLTKGSIFQQMKAAVAVGGECRGK